MLSGAYKSSSASDPSGSGLCSAKVDRVLNYLMRPLVDFLANPLYVVPFLLEIKLITRNRVATLPFHQFFLVAIKRGVMLAVPAIAIGLAFDHFGTAAFAHAGDHSLAQLDDCEQVVARNDMALEAVGLAAAGHVLDRHLLFERCRIGVAIVFAGEDHR